MAYTIRDFHKEYKEIKGDVPDYRMGQLFINAFIKGSSSNEMCKLWDEWDDSKALTKIYEIIERYNWDLNDLPISVEK